MTHRNSPRNRHRLALPRVRRGFTLIELLVALLLLDVGLLALVGLAASLYRDGDDTRATSRAWAVASARLERMASVACSGPISGSAAPAAGMAEWFTDEPILHETRLLVDSVRITTSRRIRATTLRTLARC